MLKRLFITLSLLLFAITVANGQTGVWSGKLDIQGTKLPLVFHLDDEKPTMDSPNQGAKGIPIKVSHTDSGKVRIEIPSINAQYEGVWLINSIVGRFTQMGASLPLTLTPGDDRPNRPQTPKQPFPYSTEEVSFTNGDFTLNGTLTTPANYTRSTPVVIMVTGSGKQNRDEELFDHKPFAVIADALARAGFASLRYDDRGFGDKSINILSYTTEDFKGDALAGIALLRTRFDNIGVLGHSEGGTIAMMLAAEEQVEFAISLAGMIISGAETLVWQNKVALKLAGVDNTIVEAYSKLLKEAFEATTHGHNAPNPDDYHIPQSLIENYWAVTGMLKMPYMAHFVTLDMRPLLDRISCPVLALNGTKDSQVECSSNLEALRNGLAANPKHRIEAIEALNHLFQHCTTGSVTEYNNIEESFAPEALDMIIQWLYSLTTQQ